MTIVNFRHVNKSIPKRESVKETELPKIRTVPKYDPEASIASLKYTSVSWIDTINRAIEKTEFDKVSDETKHILLENLNTVIFTINRIKKLLGEDDIHGGEE